MFSKITSSTSLETTKAAVIKLHSQYTFAPPSSTLTSPGPTKTLAPPALQFCLWTPRGRLFARTRLYLTFYSKKHLKKRTTHHKTQLPPCFCQCACLCQDNCITKTSVIEYLTFLFSCGLQSTKSNSGIEKKTSQQQVSGKK